MEKARVYLDETEDEAPSISIKTDKPFALAMRFNRYIRAFKEQMKNEVDMYLDSDKDIIQNNVRIINQKEKLAFLEEVLKNVNQRNFQIKNAIEWKKFTQGVQ